jgi:5'-deoxynucleotidase YfbR-like HD superfamily hydrolase
MGPSGHAETYIIDTSSGARLNLDNPRAEDIRIGDVAGGLSKACRFGAQAREYYSVAQHALLVRRLVAEAGHSELALVALHHDSHEAYLCDIPTPLKRMISEDTDVYDRACEALDTAIGRAFGFEWPERDSPERQAIKYADEQALLIEATRLLPDGGKALRGNRGFEEKEFGDLATLGVSLVPREAEKLFLRAHAELTTHDR